MNYKKLILATLATAFVMWATAGVWHNLIVANYYARETGASHDGIGAIIIAYVILGLFMSYMYPLGYKGGKPVLEGLRFGVIIGILWVFPHELAMVGAHGESLSYVIRNGLWHIVEQGLGGIVLGLIYGKDIAS